MRNPDKPIDKLYTGDNRLILPEMIKAGIKVQSCVTSPPYYGLRDYGGENQIGLEPTPAEYVENLVAVFQMVREVLTDDGTLWLNLGDSYAGSGKGRNGDGRSFKPTPQSFQTSNQLADRLKPTSTSDGLKAKDLIGIPWRVALALQADGWYLRQDIIWHKTNPMPESVTDRCVRSHEYLFLLSKNRHYYFNHRAIQEPSETYGRSAADKQNSFCRSSGKYTGTPIPGQGRTQHRDDRDSAIAQPMRNKRSVWSVSTVKALHEHPAAFPPNLVAPCILAGTRPGDTVLDLFSGSGTVAETATRLGRHWLGIELNPAFARLHEDRTVQQSISI
ncbi:MAG: site-specific DNA-methyltransferase [Neisseria sp.]|uniref:DNA-methyltransferase n=1 Tax=Neisseria sp. TaxID=192066 RepID=UPI0026DDC0D4|nr:site-specific DNA-methyltransferase [Neisseria sp.]MDO4641704.1 site-specific DNA-methyltransferase [Neisseria sp.]